MGTEEKVALLRRDVTAAQRRAAGADQAVLKTEAREEAARHDLEAEFGFSAPEKVQAELARLEAELETEAAEVRRQLELAGGTQ